MKLITWINEINKHILGSDYYICDVVLEGITPETRAILESMCYGCLHSLVVDDMWDLFESLAWQQWQSNDARDSYHHHSSYPNRLCSFC